MLPISARESWIAFLTVILALAIFGGVIGYYVGLNSADPLTLDPVTNGIHFGIAGFILTFALGALLLYFLLPRGEIAIKLDRSSYAAGELVKGTITITSTEKINSAFVETSLKAYQLGFARSASDDFFSEKQSVKVPSSNSKKPISIPFSFRIPASSVILQEARKQREKKKWWFGLGIVTSLIAFFFASSFWGIFLLASFLYYYFQNPRQWYVCASLKVKEKMDWYNSEKILITS